MDAFPGNCTFGGCWLSLKKVDFMDCKPTTAYGCRVILHRSYILSKVKYMPISSSHQDLFHQASAAEKISLVQSLMESGELNANVAMALLKSIHSELAQPQGQDHSLYATYARLMASLNHQMPDVHQHVVTHWQAQQRARLQPEEGSAE